MFSVRLVTADSYQSSPLTPFDLTVSEFRNSRIRNVPTIRVFGSTLSGEKVCLHIHGVFPYIYVPYIGDENSEDFAHRLAKSLDYVINVSLGSAASDIQHVYKIQQVKGVPYYGYHEKLHHYLKIYFYNPAMVKRAAELLQSGSVLNQTLQPHEAHIPFILQFMIDYKIYGMSLINLQDVKYRQANRRGPDGKLNNETLTPHFKTRDYLPPTVKRQSTCEIEVDAWASDILNKEACEKGLGVNPGLAAIWDEERARRLLAGFEGGDSQLEPPSSPLRSNLPPTDNDFLQMQRFQRKLDFISQSEEKVTSSNSNSSFYPVEINKKINLLDASYLENHVGPKNSQNKSKTIDSSASSDISLHFDSKTVQSSGEESPYLPDKTLDQSIFDVEDVPLVDLLEQLAEGHSPDEQFDDDSILGSYCSAVVDENKSDEEAENDVPDLNLTTLEVDNLNFDLPPALSVKSKDSYQENLSFSFPSSFESTDDERFQKDKKKHSLKIPQLDGADDLPRKRKKGRKSDEGGSSVENISVRKKRKTGNEKKIKYSPLLCDLSKKLNNVKNELKISSSSESISETFESELDRTIIAEENNVEPGKRAENPLGNADKDFTVVSEEKLICNYKAVVNRKKQKGLIKDQERKLSLLQSPKRKSKSPLNLLQSPRRSLKNSMDLLQSPKRSSKSPKKSLKSPGRRSPKKLLRSPRRNYSSLNIVITPSKRKTKVENRGTSEDDESSGDALENRTFYVTEKRDMPSTSKIEVSDSKAKKKLPLSQKEISEKTETSKKLMPSQSSEDEMFFSPQKSNEICGNISSDFNLFDSPETEKNLEGDEVFFSQKSEKCSKNKLNDGKETNVNNEIFSHNSQERKKSDENELEKYEKNELDQNIPSDTNSSFFLSSPERKRSEEDELNKTIRSDVNLSLSENSADEKCLADDESSRSSVLEIPLTQKPASQISERNSVSNEVDLELKSSELDFEVKSSELDFEVKLSETDFEVKSSEIDLEIKSSEMDLGIKSNEMNLLKDVPSPVEKNNVYDEKTDSSDFEENLEILLKNVSSDSEDKDPKIDKLAEKIIEEDSGDETLKPDGINILNLENAEEINASYLDIANEINNEVCDAKNLLSVTFSEFTNAELNSSFKVTKKSVLSLKPNRLVTVTTKFFAPTRQHILDSMSTYGIPTYRNQEPFYSNHNDTRQHKDSTHQLINKKDIAEFPTFKSEIGGVVGIKLWRRMKVNEFHSFSAKLNSVNVKRGLAERRLLTITPLLLPPDRKSVVNWIKSRKRLKRKEGDKIKDEKFCQKELKNKNEKNGIKESNRENCNQGNVDLGNDNRENNQGNDNLENEIRENYNQENNNQENVKLGNDNQENCNNHENGNNKVVEKNEENNQEIQNSLKNKNNQENKNEEGKEHIENSGDFVKSSPACLLPSSKELIISGENSRESFGNNSSLYSTLRPSELLSFDKKKNKNLRGVSLGQIDFSMDETKSESDVANQNLQNARAITTYQYLTILCLEVHIKTRSNLLPDPQHDPIEAVFYIIHNDVPPTSNLKRLEQGAIIVDVQKSRNLLGLYPSCKITYVTCEEDLFCNVISLISDCNPDILIGWELETLSWGYIFQRAGHLGTNLATTISRIPGSKCSWESQALDLDSLEAEIKLPGRIVLDIWRIMKHEIALLSYTFENVMFHVMHKRLPCPSFKTLTDWWNSTLPCLRWRVVDFYINKNLGTFGLLEQFDIIGRTSEHARLFGIQFFEVFSRGSQFRVESMMLRLAKPLNYILVSPNVRQRASMRAPESLPLIMEPISTFYSDPIVVLDFQSLYPSIVIAYNYCFSTCLGRVEHMGQYDPFEFGCTTLRVTKRTAMKVYGKINFSPVGIGFVKPEVRKGVLPQMLSEILNTRLMVKKAMKDHPKTDRTLQRVLHNRQLGLKLIANVTYGYTSANFSGRMPCIEIGDSIVSKGKETLQRAIKMVEDTPEWGARVVYGDTDSLFILLHGKSRNEAFKIGNEIADAVTAANPSPVKLKFEKVLHPCILQTKKRYCGYSYETIHNKEPEYLAKGIETVRRDGCPASAKILEKTLKILFDTKDLSQVKQYVTRQLDKIFRGTVSIQDLTFAREFRGMRGYSKNACVPALELTRRLMKKDPRAVPRKGERVPYIIVAGAPNEALIHSVRSPSELLADPSLRPNSIYYITRVIIPPLNRCLNLLGADVHIWFRDMPHREVLNKAVSLTSDRQKATISQFFTVHVCLSCGNSSESNVCKQCVEQPSKTIVILHEKLRSLEKNLFNVNVICRACTHQLDIPGCESLDCPVTYRRSQVEREHALVPTIRKIIDDWEL